MPTPTAQWKFDEGSGTTAIDATGNGNTGTLINGPTYSSDTPTGSGFSLNFVNTSNTYINVAGPSSPGDCSWMAWMKTSAAISNMYIMDRSVNKGTISLLNGKLSALSTGFTGGSYINQAGADLRTGVWNHIAVVQSGTTLAGYVNAVATGSASGVQVANVTGVKIGRYGEGFYTFHGLIDDVQIYNSALSASEILQIFSGSVASRRRRSQSGSQAL